MTRRPLFAYGIRIAVAAVALLFASAVPAFAQNITISIPGAEAFIVTRAQQNTAGSTTTTITWSTTGNFNNGKHLRISVKADVANFTPPTSGRTAIAANKISWTTSGATNGTGTNGTMSSSTWMVVYDSSNGKKNGAITITWTLAAPGTNIRAGNHTLTVHWRLEAL